MKGLPAASIVSEATKSRAKVRGGTLRLRGGSGNGFLRSTDLFINRVGPKDRSDSLVQASGAFA
jgi:hypothetical protein